MEPEARTQSRRRSRQDSVMEQQMELDRKNSMELEMETDK
jgi:hypothetical protein